MARIVNEGIAGELAGKLGGNVFARNRAGAYVRKNTQPIDPRTQAQIRARTAFGSMASQYHLLDSNQKTLWQTFASSVFVPKGGYAPGVLSGFNAFVSMRNAVRNAEDLKTPSIVMSNGAGAVTVTQGVFETPDTPPNNMPSAGLVDASGNPLDINFTEINCTYAGQALSQADVKIEPVFTTSPPSIDGLKMPEPGGTTVTSGFALYASNPLVQQGVFVNNPEQFLVGTTGLISVIDDGAAGPIAFDELTMNIIPQNPASDYQNWLQNNDTIEFHLYQITRAGIFRKVGSLMYTP